MLVIVTLLLISVVNSELCSDVDNILCNLLLHRVPDTCTDSCLSRFCKRSCGNCALKCYDCTDINDPGNCTSFKTCSSNDEYCFSAQSFTNDLHQAFRLGCSTKDTCEQFASSQDKRVNFDAGCCNHDKCNNKPPSLLNSTPLPTPNPIVPTSGSDFCVNTDEDTCQRFALLYPNPCQYDCVKALCPHMCQQCFYCLNCDGISNPNQCQQITVCGNGSVCYGYEKLNNDLQIVAELGCMDSQQCSILMSPANHPFNQFGRKRDFGLIGGCCTGDRCNLHPNGVPVVTTTPLPTTATPTTTVTVPNHTVPVNNCTSYVYRDCPLGFVPHGHYCYNIGNLTLNKQQAEDYCYQRCASLVKFSDKTEILEVFSYFQHKNHEAYTSLTRDIKHQYWYWESDDTIVSSQLLENDFQLTQDSCAVAYITFSVGIHSHSVYTYGLSPVSCAHNAVPMCYIRRST
ncbi:uncharacterized protein LOC143048677 [Mytilus galloprovincialis]|uniref:uncharacterized protein LOC143048677 n=1 Tax=Mytilus galloprovincialis TaxID=29158 RepID=UPI003F7C4EEF